MAQLTGGAYFNLQRTTDADVLPQLGKPVLSLVSVDVDRNAVADLEPSGAQAVTVGVYALPAGCSCPTRA